MSPRFISPSSVPHVSSDSDLAPADAPVHIEPVNGQESGVEGEMLRAVMRRVASPVTIVTAAAGGVLRGATIGSFTSVSLDPPLVSFNVQKGSSLHDVLLAADAFAVHLLGENQADLATHFAIPDVGSSEQFRTVEHAHPEPDVPPILPDVFGVLHCTCWAVHDAGDHTLFLGRVERVTEGEARSASSGQAGPLLYYDRSYRAVGDEV